MAKLSLLAAATSTLLAGSSFAATTCPADVTSKALLAVVTNVTYLNTCAPGSAWKLPTLFAAANLTASDFLTFCNATACMTPMHKLVDEIPDGCVATLNGTSVVLGDAIGAVHGKCHDALHKAGIADDDDDDDDDDDHAHAASKSGSAKANASETKTVPSPAPAATSKKSIAAATVTDATIAVAVVVASTIVALVV